MKRGLGWAFVSFLAVVALLASAGCGSKGGPRTFTVNVDGKSKSADEAFIAYFPNVVRVHPGDTVVFHEVGNGEPHTVTFGPVVDGAVGAFEKLTPKDLQGPTPASALQADGKVPLLLPTGPGDAIRPGANPCFLATGVPSARTVCPKIAQPDFNGTQAYYNSGWLDSNAKFTLHVSSSTKPGTYSFICLLHREGMSGKMVVVPSTTPVPSPGKQTALGRQQLAQIETKLQTAVAALRQGKLPVPGVKPYGKVVVLAGSGSPTVDNAEIDEFGPEEIKVPVGGSVIWYFLGSHSITFNSDQTNDDVRQTAADGTVHLNFRAFAPTGTGEPPGAPAAGGGSSASTALQFGFVSASPWDGTGFLNSGVFVKSRPPSIEGWMLTFTRAGTYKYICTVHDGMKGTVVVG